MASAIQLAFHLRTSSQCKTVHLLGSWDNYNGQLPLSNDSSVSGGWKGTFRFQPTTLTRGQRYWYYYIIDGYHVSHDPCQESTVEPTTGRRLNILDLPTSSSGSSKSKTSSAKVSTTTATSKAVRKSTAPIQRRHSRNTPADIPLGLPVEPEHIISPVPKKPHATMYLTTSDLSTHDTVEKLTKQFARYTSLSDDDDSDIDSDAGSDVPSLISSPSSTTSSANSSPRFAQAEFRLPSRVASASSSRSSSSSNGRRSAASSTSSRSSASSCSCERYGVTRRGNKLKLDCGGSRCGSPSASSDEDSIIDSSSEDEAWRTGGRSPLPDRASPTKRHAVVIREPVFARRSRK